MKIYYTYYKWERIVSVLYLVETKFVKGVGTPHIQLTKGIPHRSTNFHPMFVLIGFLTSFIGTKWPYEGSACADISEEHFLFEFSNLTWRYMPKFEFLD
jgi:hypothetical protein